VAQINAEAIAIQKGLTGHLNERTYLLSEVEKENHSFAGAMAENT
jgi:hypothetical protein